MNPTRILHISSDATWRGGEQQVLYTLEGLQARGHRVGLVTPRKSELVQRLPATIEDVYPIRFRSDLDLTGAWRLRRAIRLFSPEVLHVHSGRSLAMAIAARWMHDRRIPIVFSRRVSFPIRNTWLNRFKYNQVNLHLPISGQAEAPLSALGIPPSRMQVVAEGVDPNRWPDRDGNAVRVELGIPKDRPVICTVGHCEPVKNQHLLVDAATLVLQQRPDCWFLIVGDGPERESLVQHAKQCGVDHRVLFPGFRKDVGSFLDASDLFVMTSLQEGLCTSILDAQFSRLPVIATRVGGIPNLIHDTRTGWLVPSRDHVALAERILIALDDPEACSAVVSAANQQAMNQFTIDCMVENTLKAYCLLLQNRDHY